jgi:hypothetical protein
VLSVRARNFVRINDLASCPGLRGLTHVCASWEARASGLISLDINHKERILAGKSAGRGRSAGRVEPDGASLAADEEDAPTREVSCMSRLGLSSSRAHASCSEAV